MRSLDASRIIIFSVGIVVMAATADWRFNDVIQASMRQGRFEPFSALGNAVFIALCVGVVMLLAYVSLMHFYQNDIRIVRLALVGIVFALCAGLATRWVWMTYITEYSATRHIVTRATYLEDASVVGWLAFVLVFVLCCTWAATYVERRP